MSNLFYDGNYTISLSNDIGGNGAFCGNGKIGTYVSMSNISSTGCLISGNNQFNQIGKYTNNTINTFDMLSYSICAFDNSNISYSLVHQKIDMSIGFVETKFTLNSNNINIGNVTNSVCCLRQYPYCTFQNINLSVNNSFNGSNLDIYSCIKSPPKFTNITYNNNTVYNESLFNDKGLYMLTGSCKANDIDMAAGLYYMLDSNTTPLGFNILNDNSMTYQKIRINASPNVNYNIYSIGAVMTEYDFIKPIDEVKNILMNVAYNNSNINTFYTNNTSVWNDMWSSDVEITIKNGILSNELLRANRIKMIIRYSLYNIYSCLRSVVNTEINSLNLSYIDTNGNVFFDGDLWLIPVLLFLKPDIARSLIEFKYKLLEQASQLAASFGYKGIKYPYKNDTVGYKNVYWDVVSPLHIFNNACIAINAWNYYRVSLDKEWLLNKGYVIMKNVCDFFVSYLEYISNTYNVNNILELGKIISDNPAMTINMIILTFHYTIQAFYILGYIPNNTWFDIILKLKIPIISSGPDFDVVLFNNTYDGITQIDILSNLILLLPYYSYFYFNDIFPRNGLSVLKNIDYYSTKILPNFQNNSINNLITTALYALVSQNDNSYVDNFYDQFDNIIDTNMLGSWGNLNIYGDEKLGNDVSLNAFIILIIITCIGGLTIKGSTAPSNIITENYRIQDIIAAYMPNTWNSIYITGIGKDGLFSNVANQLTYS